MAGLRVIFMGTPGFAAVALKALSDAGHDIVMVYSQPPRPKGRGLGVQPGPVHALAEELGLPVRTPVSVKTPEAIAEFQSLQADVAVVAAYGLILPQAILDAPRHGCLNIHASVLPRWRGASPIQHAIWKGDDHSGVTIMQMERGLDTGPMIAVETTPITEDTTASSLHDALSDIGARMIVDVVATLSTDGKLSATPQDEALFTYAPMLKKTDGAIEPHQSAVETDRQVRALNPWPGTYIDGLKGRVKILKAHLQDDTLIYDIVQPEGKKPMDMVSAINGGYVQKP